MSLYPLKRNFNDRFVGSVKGCGQEIFLRSIDHLMLDMPGLSAGERARSLLSLLFVEKTAKDGR